MKTSLIFFGLASVVYGAGFTEPPVTLYGEVIHLSEGSSYQVHQGDMIVTLVNENNPAQQITLETKLGNVGAGGQFSYSLEIPQNYLPSSENANESVSVSSTEASYRFTSITIDGEETSTLDTAQSILHTSFARRGNEHRLDLAVSLPQLDSDDDGMPDWWEERHGLNSLSAADATSNTDGDDWNALEEFLRGSDPSINNREISVANANILLPDQGIAGLWLPVVDTDEALNAPAQITFTGTGLTSGIKVLKNGVALDSAAIAFTYADVLAGNITVSAEPTFGDSESISFSISDSNGNSTTASAFIRPLNPTTHNIEQPVLWLESSELADRYSDGDPVTEWGGLNSATLVAFQPTATHQGSYEASSQSAHFSSDDFLYLNDSSFSLDSFTALALFSLDASTADDATLLSNSQLEVSIGGTDQAAYAQTIKVTRDGENIFGPAINLSQNTQLSLCGSPDQSSLAVDGTARFLSQSGPALSAAFGTIGAKQATTDSTASGFLPGKVSELILFDEKLDPGALSRLEDYQLSRWQDVVLWDFRSETSPIVLTGRSDARNSLNGGWGKDDLSGGALADILRGGPANDTLTGLAGADRFQFFLNDGDDLVTDFSENDGDILDLSPIFENYDGIPSDYLTLSSVIDYQPGVAPTVSTKITLLIDGLEQSITLRGATFSNSDLPRLVGGGILYLGGPRFESSLSLLAEESELTETEYARSITLTRTGNTDSASEVYLSLVGTAEIENDYSVGNRDGSGVVHRAIFPAGMSSIQVDLTPIQDSLPESETIQVAILPSADFPVSEAPSVELTLSDAPQITINSLVSHAQRLGSVPGVIEVSRDGDLTQPMDVSLSFDGSAINGEDFVQVSPVISFNAGEQTKTLNITPSVDALDKGQAKLATLSVVPDTTQYATLSPWSASVMILDKLNGEPKDYQSYRASLPAEFAVEGGLANPDSDGISLYSEYVHGLDPTAADDPNDISVSPFVHDGRFVMEVPTRAGLTDVRLYPAAFSAGLPDVSDNFEHTFYSISDDRVMHVFTSRQSVSEVTQSQLFVLRSIPVAAPNLETSPSSLLSSPDQTYLITGSQSGWTPASDAAGLAASPRDAGESSAFETIVNGAQPVSFDWEVPAGSGATITFTVDGVTVATLTDGNPAATINHTLSGSGAHTLKWTITYGTVSDSTLTHHGLVKNVSF